MQKLKDNEIKSLFSTIKTLMFWPHPKEYLPFIEPFHLRQIDTVNWDAFSEEQQTTLVQQLHGAVESFPLSVYIETTNRCNLKCVMCPNQATSRSKGSMADNVFKKIIDEIADKQPSITVSPFYFGEPLVDNSIFNKIRYCKQRGLTFLKMSTNGSLLAVNDNYKKLIDSGLDHLIISFDGITKGTYESIRVGAQFEQFVDGVQLLVSYKKQTQSPMLITGQMINMPDNSLEKELFTEFVTRLGLVPYFASFQYWGAKPPIDCKSLDELRYPCNNPLYSAVILHNGDLAGCCMDCHGKAVFGNIANDSLQDLWTKRHSQFRAAQLNRKFSEYAICSQCYDWISFGYNKYSNMISLKNRTN